MSFLALGLLVIISALGIIAFFAVAARRSANAERMRTEQPDMSVLLRTGLLQPESAYVPQVRLRQPDLDSLETVRDAWPPQPPVVEPPSVEPPSEAAPEQDWPKSSAQSEIAPQSTESSHPPHCEEERAAPFRAKTVLESVGLRSSLVVHEAAEPTLIEDLEPAEASSTHERTEQPGQPCEDPPPRENDVPAIEAKATAGRDDAATPLTIPQQSEAEPAASTKNPAQEATAQILASKPQAVHRDSRGRRRSPKLVQEQVSSPVGTSSARARLPAEVRLRLILHPIQQTVQLSLMLARPEGFPATSSIEVEGPISFQAFDESRYDDIDIAWLPTTLIGELRFASPDGYRWVRSARRIHIFASDPSEAGLISVSAARLGAEHTVVCTTEDASIVNEIAASTGSPALVSHDHWQGIPAGWCVLSRYIPKRAAENVSDATLSTLDPRYDLEIKLIGGLVIRPGVFAERHPPLIEIAALPDGVSVIIDGEEAVQNGVGGWEAAEWNQPGSHLIDVVPGPSLTYEIVGDPAEHGGWELWDAHEGRFSSDGPWARARICGAALSGPSGETVLAHEARQTLIALGSRQDAVGLCKRSDAEVSVALLSSPPAFLIETSGPRRRQGEVVWLGLERPSAKRRAPATSAQDHWASIVRSAASRRLPLRTQGSSIAKTLWIKTVRRARSLKRRRP